MEHVTITERMEEAMREVGVLLIAFAPLDMALNRTQSGDFNFLMLFLGLGASLFTGALISERKRGTPPFGPPSPLLYFLIIGVILMLVGLKRIVWG